MSDNSVKNAPYHNDPRSRRHRWYHDMRAWVSPLFRLLATLPSCNARISDSRLANLGYLAAKSVDPAHPSSGCVYQGSVDTRVHMSDIQERPL